MCPRCLAHRHAVKLVRSTLADPEREAVRDGSVSASGLRLTVETRGDETVVRLAGALDIASAPVAARTVAAADTREGPLVLDLSELSFMDSSGYRCLLRLRRDHGERVVFVPPPESVLRLFRQVGLAQHLGLDG